MKLRSILAAIAVMACGSVFAQNATKAELDALAQRVSKLEMDLERVITENVNLVEQLNVRTVTSFTDKNQLQWDIVKVEPNESDNTVILTLRVTNTTGVIKSLQPVGTNLGKAIDTDSNLQNNTYTVSILNGNADLRNLRPNIPVNFMVKIWNVPLTCSYLATINLNYIGVSSTSNAEIKFSGVHIPW